MHPTDSNVFWVTLFVAPAICRWVADNHPRARAIEFPGVGHAPFIEEREGYLAGLIEFVGEEL